MKQNTIPTQDEKEQSEQAKFTKQIGSTTYQVNVHFSETSKETLTDKILRLIKREAGGL